MVCGYCHQVGVIDVRLMGMDVVTMLMLLMSGYWLWMLPLGQRLWVIGYRCQVKGCRCYHLVDVIDVRLMDVDVTTRLMSG